MTTQEQNKMIAEFMGWLPRDRIGLGVMRYYRHGSDTGYLPENLKYHTSWDWLMPVVQKILNRDDQDFPDTYTLYVSDALHYADISKLYESVIEFIQWYNQSTSKP